MTGQLELLAHLAVIGFMVGGVTGAVFAVALGALLEKVLR